MTNLVATIVIFFGFELSAGAEEFTVEIGRLLIGNIIAAAIGAAIWIPYFNFSKRVKTTFIN